MEVTGSQMCAAYTMATQLVDRQVLLEQFSQDRLDRDEVWDLVNKTTCSHDPYFDLVERLSGARVTVTFEDEFVLESLDMPRGFDPWVTNEQLVEKYRMLGDQHASQYPSVVLPYSVIKTSTMEPTKKSSTTFPLLRLAQPRIISCLYLICGSAMIVR